MKKYILFVILIMIVLVFALNRGETVTLHQSVEEVVKVDFMRTHNYDERMIYTLAEEEIPDCMESVLKLPIKKSWSPEQPGGHYIIQITYADGSVESLGNWSVSYLSGGELEHDGWYYVPKDDLYALISQYVAAEKLAELPQ